MGLRVRLDPVNVRYAKVEAAGGVVVAIHHQVREPRVVRQSDCRHGYFRGEQAVPVVRIDRRQCFETRLVVAQHAMGAEEANQRKVTEHAEDVRRRQRVSLRGVESLSSVAGELFSDTRARHEGLERLYHRSRVPETAALVCSLEGLDLLGSLAQQLPPVLEVRLPLPEVLVNHVPEPPVRQLHVQIRVENDTEELRVVFPALPPLVQRGGSGRVDMAEVQLLVERQIHVIVVDQVGDRLRARPGPALEKAI
mmetsp:Transcript_4904/g.14207  ORF Transcript_4904/g.14207 Transcript_4904/m.14207 type:complete len:252 (-) Transcript_4904:237-992(-)